MRFLHIISSMGGGGAERQLCYLVGAHTASGHDVHVALSVGGVNLPRLQAAGAVIHHFPGKRAFNPLVPLRILHLCRTLRPDVVQAWNTPHDIYCGLLCPIAGVNWVLAERNRGPWNTANLGFLPLAFLLALMRRLTAPTASAIVCNSQAAVNRWEGRWWRRVRREFIANGLPLDEIEAAEPERDVPEHHRLLWAGRFIPAKNWETVIHALAAVFSERAGEAVLCGEGEFRAKAEQLTHALGMSDRIRFIGYTDELWSLMKTAAAFINMSWQEGRPNTVLEAAACGCPLVVSSIPEHLEFLDENTAVFADPHDRASVAAAIAAVLDDRAAAQRRARAAKDMVAAWSIPAAADRYLALYRELNAAGK